MAYSDLEIRNAWEDSLAQGFTPEQIYQGALANFGLSREQVDSALGLTSVVPNSFVQRLFQPDPVAPSLDEPVPDTFTTASGQTLNFNDVSNLIQQRYSQGKNPALAVKSAIQLGFPEEVILRLPGVTPEAYAAGRNLIISGAFDPLATGSEADTQKASLFGSNQYKARIAAGLDAFGFPPEEVALLTQQGLYGPGKKYDPGVSFIDYNTPVDLVGTASSGGTMPVFTQAANMNSPVSGDNVLSQQAQEVLAKSGKANDSRYADSIVGTFVNNGITYNVQGDGSFTTISETPDQVVTTTTFTPEGQEVGTYVDDRFKTTGFDRLLETAAYAALAAGTAAGLGPAGVGLFGVPGAAAAGSGATSLIRTGSVKDALTSAALGGLTAYGLQGLLGGSAPAVDDFVAADVAQLAAQGIPEQQIAQILSQEGLSSSVINAALDAQFGVSAPGSAKGLGDFSSTPTGETVPVTGSGLFNTDVLTSALSGGLATLPSTAVPGVTETVPVTGQNLPNNPVTVEDLLSVLTPALTATLPVASGGSTQQVDVTGSRGPSTTETIINSLVPALTSATLPSLDTPTQPTDPNRVEVTEKKETPLLPTLGSAVTAALPGLTPDITKPLPKPTEPISRKEDSLFKPSDILRLIGLLGGLTAGSKVGTGGMGTGTSQASTSSLGTTTPNYGDDYYSRLQGYYNSYMPQYPRDVSTPLRQWYENKYGA